MQKKILLPAFWVIALISVFTLSSSFSDKSLHFFGIAGEREQTINFQYPVEVVQSFVVEGKEVKQGQDILEVRRPELVAELSSLGQEIRKHQLQKQESENSINSQLANLKAKKHAVTADMDYQINSLKLRLKINSDMIHSISGSGRKKAVVRSTELNDLKRKRYFSAQAIQAEIDGLTQQLNASNRPIDEQINTLHTRKEELRRQSVSLKVKAQFNGRIGSVNFKAGELVSPFQAIMSVHSSIPRYIKGYINENILNDVQVGQTVWVSSIAFNKEESQLAGVVESLGNRIIEYPERLKKHPLVQAWGREVIVRLNNLDHALLFGEKVQVLLETPEHSSQAGLIINEARASYEDVFDNQPTAQPIKYKNTKKTTKKIEASGIVWNPKAEHYLLLSDETSKAQENIFIMNEEGLISEKLSMLKGKQHKIDDLESISMEDDVFYILSSLSHNKKDKLKTKRKKIVRFKYQKKHISEQQEINLYEVLIAIKDAPGTDKRLALFITQAIENHSMDIESHFVKNNVLYLGFKSPYANGQETLIVRLHDVKAMFEGNTPQADIWKSIALLDPETGDPMKLSDMLMVDDQLFLLSISRSSVQKSVLWRYQNEHNRLENITQFPGLKAEGISYRQDQSLFMVVFDEGKKKPSKYQTYPYSILPRS